ncbi:MAG: hypothetical protein U0270_43965 [Labilithrix sp.]
MRSGADLYTWLASLPPSERDPAVEAMLGVEATSSASPGPHLVGHHMTGLGAIVRAIHEVPVRADDVVLDLGAGVGKLLALVHLLTGARVRGVELQRELVDRSIDVANVRPGDARDCDLDATVIFLYCPFDGPVLDEVSRRLDATKAVVCTLGVDLRCARLRPRARSDFWMTIWDAGEARIPLEMDPLAQALAHERIDH